MQKPGKISPSMMCADFRNLEREVAALTKAGVEYLHFDIMDGHFVPNFTLGPDLMKCIREMTDIPFDLHLMIERPDAFLSIFDIHPGDIVSVHQEASVHLQRVLQLIKDKGAKASVALNPATSIHTLEDILDDIELVLIMTVNPGFAGQRLVPATLKKITALKHYLLQGGYTDIEIEVDGNVSYENARKMRDAGADIFVAGTSSIFKKNQDVYELTRQFRPYIA